VEDPPPGREQPTAGDLPDPLVREVEALADFVQHPPPDELLEATGDGAVVQDGGPLQQGEVELTADERGHGDQLPRDRREAVQTPADDVPHAFRQREVARRW
jgi:hypothetical protein